MDPLVKRPNSLSCDLIRRSLDEYLNHLEDLETELFNDLEKSSPKTISSYFSIDSFCQMKMRNSKVKKYKCGACALLSRILTLDDYSWGDSFLLECGDRMGTELMVNPIKGQLLSHEKVFNPQESSFEDQRLHFLIDRQIYPRTEIQKVVLNFVLRNILIDVLAKYRVKLSTVYTIFKCHNQVYSLEEQSQSICSVLPNLSAQQLWSQVLLVRTLLLEENFIWGRQSLDKCRISLRSAFYEWGHTKENKKQTSSYDFTFMFDSLENSLIRWKDRYLCSKQQSKFQLDLSQFDTLMLPQGLYITFNNLLSRLVSDYRYSNYLHLYVMVDCYRILISLLLYEPIQEFLTPHLTSICQDAFLFSDLPRVYHQLQNLKSSNFPSMEQVDQFLCRLKLNIALPQMMQKWISL